ncbi:hypothetical protein [Paenibacillus macerans]|uniref:Putative lipoprotein n=1 Tax=Paenibacillus macerans TaxID=44252 RepID=A0A090YRA6_PAEMA|nr:hypothetical protein [Paenibacillus macerans]KFN00960.1 putative lipoprotein [Paenibacillus macerans]MCY7556714.1 hypothetical protein [Paenibacillus macerans]MEC0150839.1 hypothetical protein [Paenibacillus macerans]SUA85094.1 Uncharacterised protein [Paenibacillus macerans]GIP14080.1 hypothetical protein J1TS5_62500 [Paenibacillus macerans]
MKKKLSLPCLLFVLSALLLQACGKDESLEGGAGSFGTAASAGTAFSYEVQSSGTAESEQPQQEPASNNNPAVRKDGDAPGNERTADSKLKAAATPDKAAAPDTAAGAPGEAASAAGAGESGKGEEKKAEKPESADDGLSSASNSKKPGTAKSGQSQAPGKHAAAASPKSSGSDGTPKVETSGAASETARTSASDKAKGAKSGVTTIGWSEFFDGDDQTTPSERFWDLSGSTVTIKGFMGEVLSFENHWFLLIPEPGAECPFDNGDETYWNKIMIVFVPDDVNLRYKPEALQITGRLDVGIKIDESGYKTMFRLYDAAFEEIKE